MDLFGFWYKDSEKMVNGPGENLTQEEWMSMLRRNTAAVKAVDKAWPKELYIDLRFKAFATKYGAYPFFVPLQWCQSLCQILLQGFADGVQNKKRKKDYPGTLDIKGTKYEGYYKYGKHHGSYNQARAQQNQFQFTTLFERRELSQIRDDVTWMNKIV